MCHLCHSSYLKAVALILWITFSLCFTFLMLLWCCFFMFDNPDCRKSWCACCILASGDADTLRPRDTSLLETLLPFATDLALTTTLELRDLPARILVEATPLALRDRLFARGFCQQPVVKETEAAEVVIG